MSHIRLAVAAAFVAVGFMAPAFADSAGPEQPPPENARNGSFPQQTGEALYQGICQGCHMSDGKGAVGAANIRRWPTIRIWRPQAILSASSFMA